MNLNWFKTLFRRRERPEEETPIEEQVKKTNPIHVKDLITEKSDDSFSDMLKQVQVKQEKVERFDNIIPSGVSIQQPQPMQPQPNVQYIRQPMKQYPQPTFRERMHYKAKAKVNEMFGHGKTNEQLGQIFGANPGSDLRGKI